jgi:hypothetical protein
MTGTPIIGLLRGTLPNRAVASLTLMLAHVALAVASAFPGDEPDWVRKHPVIQGYYVGIGMARKVRTAAESAEAAKNVARNDIAGQISVSISSDVLRTVLEENEKVREEFTSSIRASATADLENLELVDTYESDEEYWVYLRLSKADFQARRAAKLEAAAGQALDLYAKGRESERAQDVATAIGLYARAFAPVEKYLAEPLTLDDGGRQVYLLNEMYGSLRSLLEKIELRPVDAEREGTIGRPLTPPLELTAVLKGPRPSPVTGIPVRFAFTRGAGDCVDRAQTNAQGIVRCPVRKITSSESIQSVEATLDLEDLADGDRLSPTIRALLGSFPLPRATFVLNISGVDVFVRSEESIYGALQEQKRIEPLLKSGLESRGYVFVEEKSRATLAILIRADVRRGQESHGLAFAYASGTVSVTDLETGREIFADSINDVKEGSDSFEKAGARSLSTLARRIANDLVPRIIEKTQR